MSDRMVQTRITSLKKKKTKILNFHFRYSNFSKPLSQTVATAQCCGWRSWVTSATLPSDTSAGFVTECCAIPSRTTGRTRWTVVVNFLSPVSQKALHHGNCSLFPSTGIHSQTIPLHAEADRIWRAGRGHDNGFAPQQPQAVGEAHHCGWDRHLCHFSEEESGAEVGPVGSGLLS